MKRADKTKGKKLSRKDKKMGGFHKFLVSILIILFLFFITLVLLPQGNAYLRSKTNSTPLDEVAMWQIKGSLKKDASSMSKEVLKTIESVPSHEIIEATSSQTKLENFLTKNTKLTNEDIVIIADELFHDEGSKSILNEISAGDWYAAQKKATELKSSGKIKELYDRIVAQTHLSAQAIQNEASKAFNEGEEESYAN